MLAPRVLVLALTVIIASACSAGQEGRVESYCQLDILDSISRPETADFSDFYEITKQEYSDLLTGMMIDNLPERTADEPRYMRAAAESAIRMTSRDVADRTADRGALFYRYKVISRDRLDQPQPLIQICFAHTDRCSCMSRETFAGARAAGQRR